MRCKENKGGGGGQTILTFDALHKPGQPRRAFNGGFFKGAHIRGARGVIDTIHPKPDETTLAYRDGGPTAIASMYTLYKNEPLHILC